MNRQQLNFELSWTIKRLAYVRARLNQYKKYKTNYKAQLWIIYFADLEKKFEKRKRKIQKILGLY